MTLKLCSLLRKYLVTLPARLDFPSTQRICLDLRAGSRDVKFTVTLETKDKTQKLLELPGMKRARLQCGSFVVSAGAAPTAVSPLLSCSLALPAILSLTATYRPLSCTRLQLLAELTSCVAVHFSGSLIAASFPSFLAALC